MQKGNNFNIKNLARDKNNSNDLKKEELSTKDHFASLRYGIQELIQTDEEMEDEKIKLLKELISPELIKRYKEILKQFRDRSGVAEDHPEREFIDINDDGIERLIEGWIVQLKKEIEAKHEKLNEDEANELEAEIWLFFDSLSSALNTKSIERDIKEYIANNSINIQDENSYAEAKKNLIENLKSRYPLGKNELNILIDAISNFKEYNIKKVFSTLYEIYNRYDLAEIKGDAIKTVMGYLTSAGISALGPYLMQDAGSEKALDNFKALAGFFGTYSVSHGMDTKIEMVKLDILKHLDLKINEQITDYLFYQEFKYVHEKSLAEIYTILERGKDAINDMVNSTITNVIPTVFGSAASLALLTKINPVLGSIGIGSIPIMYYIARKQNKEIAPIYQKEMGEKENANQTLGVINNGLEEARTSPNIYEIAESTRADFDNSNKEEYKRIKKETVMNYKRMFPSEVSTYIAIGVGALLQQKGLISPGAVLSNVMYSSRLTDPVKELINIYYSKYPRQIQDIEKMYELLGEEKNLDMPDGGRERNRVSIQELKNFDISIKNLTIQGSDGKNILERLNLDIKEGDFVTIMGESGGGKSTLFKSLVRLLEPKSGSIKIGNVELSDIKKYGPESTRKAIGYYNQNPHIFPEMTVRENLLLWAKDSASDEEVKKVLKNLRLDKFINELDEPLKYASGGEMVRIGLARVLLKNSKIILLDEPVVGLDEKAKEESMNIILGIRKKYPDKTIICISHDAELMNISDRVVDISEIKS